MWYKALLRAYRHWKNNTALRHILCNSHYEKYDIFDRKLFVTFTVKDITV